MTRIFTKSFERLSKEDQYAVVTSVLRDLSSSVGRHLDPADDEKAYRKFQTIIRKARERGIPV